MQELKLILKQEDFPDEIAPPVRAHSSPLGAEIGERTSVESGNLRQAVMDALPKVLARRIESIWNVVEGFELASFEVKVGIEGKPFGVGVDGEAKLLFQRLK